MTTKDGSELHAATGGGSRDCGLWIADWGLGWSCALGRLCVLGALAVALLPGCAAWRATEVAADTARMVAVTLIEKANFEQTSAEAGGSIENPTYEVLALYAQGILLRVSLDGVQAGGQIRGAGGGPDKALSPETLEALRARGLGPDDIELLIKALLDAARPAAGQPGTGGQATSGTQLPP